MIKNTFSLVGTSGFLLRILLVVSFLLWLGFLTAASPKPPLNTEQASFIRLVSDLAILEQAKSGIPASITAAQAIFESSWGNSRLATAGNNFFGIKCKTYWVGDTVLHKDDDYTTAGELRFSCFRAYDDVAQSFADHSTFLLESERYAPLFKLDVTDYKAWAHGLKACGYATDPLYAEKIIGLIERLELQKLDVQQGLSTSASLIPSDYVPSGAGTRPVERTTLAGL